MNYQLNQALYAINGKKIGWVQKVKSTGDAVVKSHLNGQLMEISLGALISGNVKTKQNLRDQNIPRQTPALVLPGNRLWQGPMMYRGTVTKVMHKDLFQGEFICHTDLGQAVSSVSLLDGSISIGRRTHVDCQNPT